MATVAFTDTSKTVVKEVSVADARTTKVLPDRSVTKITDIEHVAKNFEPVSHPISKPIFNNSIAKPEQILPFRVRFTSMTVEGYTQSRPAPVGIAIIGVNNYIL
jgi:hypothetical protein